MCTVPYRIYQSINEVEEGRLLMNSVKEAEWPTSESHLVVIYWGCSVAHDRLVEQERQLHPALWWFLTFGSLNAQAPLPTGTGRMPLWQTVKPVYTERMNKAPTRWNKNERSPKELKLFLSFEEGKFRKSFNLSISHRLQTPQASSSDSGMFLFPRPGPLFTWISLQYQTSVIRHLRPAWRGSLPIFNQLCVTVCRQTTANHHAAAPAAPAHPPIHPSTHTPIRMTLTWIDVMD